ncbi:MAG: tandem-95 repeat protein [Planctomycetales bacterium]|nr:tandem-95 repeat protein [Planctomycetales bacterium]
MVLEKLFSTNSSRLTKSMLRRSLQLEPLQQRVVFAGLSPMAVNDTYEVAVGQLLEVQEAGILANDTDPEQDPLSAVVFRQPDHGTLNLNPNGSLSYHPDADFLGTDSFLYQVSDGNSLSNLGAVSIQIVEPRDSIPDPIGEQYALTEDGELDIGRSNGLLANENANGARGLTVELVSNPQHGQLDVAADGSFTYVPDPDYFGTDTFQYVVSDGELTSVPVSVELSITPVNDLPIANNDRLETAEDMVLDIAPSDLTGNDTDVDGDALQIEPLMMPANGSLEYLDDGTLRYTPAQDFSGLDAFTYRVSDGNARSQVAVVEVLVHAVNDAPVARNDEYFLSEDSPLEVDADGVLANDSDADGDPLEARLVDPPEHGALQLASDGSFSFIPESNFNGTDAFTYQAYDGSELSSLVVVQLNIAPTNDAPVAQADSYETSEDVPLIIGPSGVLVNDSDVDGDNITAQLISEPEHGSVTLESDGSFAYTPDANFNGIDTFSYVASDGQAESTAVAVEINVLPINDAPVAANDKFTIAQRGQLVVEAPGVLGNDSDVDGDALTAVLVEGPAHGQLELQPDGSFTYTPATDFYGTDAFTYVAHDGTNSSDVSVVELEVVAQNSAPIAMDDFFETRVNVTLDIPAPGVAFNDSDPDGDALTVALTETPQHGTVELTADGSFVYVPETDYVGQDQFSYSVSDGELSASAVVSINVRGENQVPLAVNDAYQALAGQTLAVDVTQGLLANDSDPDGDPLQTVLFRGPKHGELQLQMDGSFLYTPDIEYAGLDSFIYRVSDGQLESSLAAVSLMVSPNESQAAITQAPTNQHFHAHRHSRLKWAMRAALVDAVMSMDPIAELLAQNQLNCRALETSV